MPQPNFTLITGAAGFVGSALVNKARKQHWHLRKAVRSIEPLATEFEGEPTGSVPIGDIGPGTDWSKALVGCDTVIHLAARVHVMHESAANPLELFCRANALATAQLARQAAATGVRRLVYASTIKVHGEATQGNRVFSENDTPAPQDFYALSKWQAELSLHQIARQTGLEVVVLRPALMHGPGVRGNFLQMLKVLNWRLGQKTGIPLPLEGINNRRHMLHVENFVDALMLCASHPLAAGNTYCVADDHAFSTSELLRILADGIGVDIRLWHMPPAALKIAGQLVKRAASVDRLLDSLQVNSNKLRETLQWRPTYTALAGFQNTAAHYRSVHPDK